MSRAARGVMDGDLKLLALVDDDEKNTLRHGLYHPWTLFPIPNTPRSGASKRQAGQPSCHYGGQHRNRAIEPRLTRGKFEHRRVDPDLEDDERGRLPTDDVLAAHQEHLDEVGAGRH